MPGKPGRRRIRLPTIALVLGLGFGGVVLLAAAALYFTLSSSLDGAALLLRDRNERIVAGLVDHVESYLKPVERQAAFVAAQIGAGRVGPRDSSRLIELLTGSLAAAPQVDSISYVAEDLRTWHVDQRGANTGDVQVYFEDLGRFTVARDRLSQTMARGEAHWGEMIWHPTLGQPMVNYREVVTRQGQPFGVVTSLVSIGRLSRFLAAAPRSFVLYGRDRVLAHADLVDGRYAATSDDPLPRLDAIDDPVLRHIWDRPMAERFLARLFDRDGGHVVEIDGKPWVFVYRELEGYGAEPWLVGYYFPLGDLRELFGNLRETGIVAFGLLAIAVLLGIVFSRLLIGPPIRTLATEAGRVRDLDFEGEAVARPRVRELAEAWEAFEAMRRALRLFAAYVPRNLVKRLLAEGPEALESREREATIMFTDIVGFTSLAETMKPPEVAAFLNHHFALVAQAVEPEGGVIDKYIGDCAMIGWGIVRGAPNHALRALGAGRRLARLLAADNEARRARGLEPIRVRVGIHSGRVIAGNIGAPGRINYTVVGDTVNIAQRLEQLGKTRTPEDVVILVSGTTAETAGEAGAADLEPIGAHRLRGRKAPLELYRLRLSLTNRP